jgi:hypothetical protein
VTACGLVDSIWVTPSSVNFSSVAADAGHRRLDHAEDGGGGDGGIDGVAARPEHIEGGDARLRVRSGGHPADPVGHRFPRHLEIAQCLQFAHRQALPGPHGSLGDEAKNR